MMNVTCTYKTYSLEITKEDDTNYFKCLLVGNVHFTPIKISNDSLEKVLHTYKSHIDGFNTGLPGHLMELNIKYKDETLKITKYDPNINKISEYKTGNLLFFKSDEFSLDKLVQQFIEYIDNKENKINIKITSTYKGYPVEVKYERKKLYSCTIKTRYGIEDREITAKPIDYILYHQQIIVDNYKDLEEIKPNERIYHVLAVEYKGFTLKAYYNYNTNQTFFSHIINPKDTKDIIREDLDFTSFTNTQELIDQFISFIERKEEKKLDEEKFDSEELYTEREVICKEDVWYNIEVKNRKHLKDLKKLEELANKE